MSKAKVPSAVPSDFHNLSIPSSSLAENSTSPFRLPKKLNRPVNPFVVTRNAFGESWRTTCNVVTPLKSEDRYKSSPTTARRRKPSTPSIGRKPSRSLKADKPCPSLKYQVSPAVALKYSSESRISTDANADTTERSPSLCKSVGLSCWKFSI